MQKLPEIKATYDWFFAHYSSEATRLAGLNDILGIDRIESKRDIFERGVFVLMFGQFEKEVTVAFEKAVAARATNHDWKRRRGWDTTSVRSKKVPFETKLAMVLDSQSPSFAKIMQTYSFRNHCAHGGTTNPVGSIDLLENDIYNWISELQK